MGCPEKIPIALMGRNLTVHEKNNSDAILDTQILSDFIYELNISRRHLSTYPPGHPMILSSTEKALALLGQLFDFRETVTLGIAQNALMFEQNWLDRSNPVYRDFAAALFKAGVAAIHFHRQPTPSELVSVNQLLRSDRQTIAQSGGFASLLEQLQVNHIELTPLDYSNLHATDEQRLEMSQDARPIWQNFLSGLLSDSLDPTWGKRARMDKFDPKIVAEVLNQKFSEATGQKEQHYERAITSFLGKVQSLDENAELSRQLGSLISQLTPELKRQFLSSTFQNLAGQPDNSKQVLENFSPELVLESLQEVNQKRLHISETMLNLLGKLSSHHQGSEQQSLTSGKQQAEDQKEEKLRTIFREEENDKFNPQSYQRALNQIISFDRELQLPEEQRAELLESMAELSTERHSCAIIFQLLADNKFTAEQIAGLQQNLIDLAHYFLEVGDFTGLQELHCALLAHRQQPEHPLEQSQELFDTLHTPEFQQEVLENLPRWSKAKQQQIRAYIQATGAAFAETLIRRLAEEPDKGLRRFYLDSLVSLGQASHPSIYAALQDERWFLVRNLIAVLRLQKLPVELAAIEPLERHPHLRVNQEVLKLLFQNDHSRANSLLLKQLNSTDPALRSHAIQLAELSSDPAIAAKLIKLLNAEKLTEQSLPLKLQIIKTLGLIGHEDALPAMRELLFSKKLFSSNRLQQIQREIIQQLTRYPYQRVRPLLQQLALDRRGELSKLAAEKLRELVRSAP